MCGLGSVTGLHGANCYHDYNPFIPGVSVRNYTDEELEEMITKENTPKQYMGKEYTAYQALQKQRQRDSKEGKISVADAAVQVIFRKDGASRTNEKGVPGWIRESGQR